MLSSSQLATKGAGLAALVAGLCYLPLVVVSDWQGAPAIATPSWWLVQTPATIHHLFLLFGLIGIHAVLLRPGALSSLGAFVTASVGNLLVTGVGAVQLTILPALAAHPTAASGIDCMPFYRAATAAARAFIERACEPWQFSVLDAWVAVAWLSLVPGSIWLGVEIVRGRSARPAGVLLAAGWAIVLVGLALPLPDLASRGAYLAIAAAYGWCGLALLRHASGRTRQFSRATEPR